MKTASSKRRFYAALAGTAAVALCCFTPVLVLALAAVGLGAFTPYLDYVFYPALLVMGAVTVLAYRKWRWGCAPQSGIPHAEGGGRHKGPEDESA